ncbi:hypothetical protein JCM19314_2561 [Nonlabens ulvanivorans]|uniref:HTH cro/C1-type domain-containing protein n=1 Tax=Nonlabens ulvanivorans TaxID=906888 RepID=A0A090Q6D1_NONUL|nr:hypothetical protein JCM19314_2561 [Nonlabens ulvanivorans]
MMQRLGEHLRKLRSDKGISQEELAKLSTVNLRTIQRIENNETSLVNLLWNLFVMR